MASGWYGLRRPGRRAAAAGFVRVIGVIFRRNSTRDST
jgi:hypothetical protein